MIRHAPMFQDAVTVCIESLMQHGTNRYGEAHAPILVSLLGLRTLACPENPETLDERRRVIRRGRRNPAGANLLMDQPILAAMFRPCAATGNGKYGDVAPG